MNKLVASLLNDVIKKKKPSIPDKVAINAIHYIMSVIAGNRRVMLQLERGKTVTVNYYGITFAPSGRGKDLSVDLVKPIAKMTIEKYYEEMEAALTLDPEAHIPSAEFKEGSTSGFMQDRQVLDSIGIGSTNIRVQELLATMKSSDFDTVMNLLVESWQEGANEARAFKSYVSPPIVCVPMNCLLYSSPEGFRNSANKSFSNFINELANGLARRSYVVFDESIDEIEDTPTIESIELEEKLHEEADKEIDEIVEYCNNIARYSKDKVITVGKEAKLITRLYGVENKNKTIKNQLIKNAVKADMLNRDFKVIRLAALYCLFDGADEISAENVRDAIEWAELLNKDLSIVLNAETVQEQIYDYLVKASKYVSETDIRKYLGISATDFKESKAELFSVAYENGSVVQEKLFDKEGRVVRYNLIHGKKTNPESMICSASNHPAQGFKALSIGFNDIPNLIKGTYGKNYSAGTFVDAHRKIENFIKRSNLIILDIDDGTTMEDARFKLSNYRGFIATTKSHGVEKNGKPACDRFRVVLVSKFEFNLEPEEHKATIKNFARFVDINIDNNAVEVARFYYAFEPSVIDKLPGGDLVDLRDYVPETELAAEAEKVIQHVAQVTRKTDTYEPNSNINAFDVWTLRNAMVGSRNQILYRTFRALQGKKGASFEEAKRKIYELNSMLIEPLEESELEITLLRDDQSSAT